MDPYLQVLVTILLIMSGIIGLFLAAIVAMRLLASNDEKKYRLWEKEWEAFFLDYMLGDLTLKDIPANLKNNPNPTWLRRFFAPYLETLDGRDFDAVKALCREIGLIDYHRKKLSGLSTYKKAIAAKFLGQVRCKESVPERIKMLESNKPLLVLASAQGLAVSNEPGTFRPVLKALLNDTYFTYEGITELLTRFGRDICIPITQMLNLYSKNAIAVHPAPAEQRHKKVSAGYGVNRTVYIIILIDLLGHFKYIEAIPVLNRMLAKVDSETIIHILKAFLRLGQLPEKYDPKPYLLHQDWVVRSFAAQTTGLAKDMSAIILLDQLLEDEQWWVRYHAAKALLSLGEPGYSRLWQKQKKSPESKAAAISSYILAAKEVGQ